MSDDLIRRSDAIEALKNALCELGGDEWGDGELGVHADDIDAVINGIPTIDIVFCKECKHRPVKEDADGENYGFNIIAPEGSSRCPCLVEDGWYSWMPKDNFFCGYGEREDE